MPERNRNWRGLPAECWDVLMGTLVHQRVYGIAGAFCTELARAEIERLERLWSVFRPDSEVSELGRRAGERPFSVSPETSAILGLASELRAFTKGAFDVTAGAAVELWRRAAASGRSPTASEVTAARALIGECVLEVSERTVQLRRRGQRLDLGAIGKGYAADRCVSIYLQHGIRHGMIDLGGNVAVVGGAPDRSAWRIGIQIPGGRRGEYFGYVEARDCSVVTSGNYERNFELDGRQYSHVIDPRTGWPVPCDALSVTVMHASSAYADALATALLVMGRDQGFTFAQDNDLDALLFDRRNLRVTAGMARAFHAA